MAYVPHSDRSSSMEGTTGVVESNSWKTGFQNQLGIVMSLKRFDLTSYCLFKTFIQLWHEYRYDPNCHAITRLMWNSILSAKWCPNVWFFIEQLSVLCRSWYIYIIWHWTFRKWQYIILICYDVFCKWVILLHLCPT